MRGQAELPALAIAFVLLTGTVVAGVVLANSALTAAERPAEEGRLATSLSDRLVSADADHTARENVLDAETLDELDEAALRERYNVPDGTDVTVTLDGDPLVETGTGEGTTVERVVLVERRTHETITPDFDNSRNVALPRRTSNVTLVIDPPAGASVEQVYANDRVVLSNGEGLEGTFAVSLSPYETTTLRFVGGGILEEGSVQIEYEPPETTRALLQVSVNE